MINQHDNPSRDFEDLLDRALTTYTPTEPRANLENRILARITAETEVPHGRSAFSLHWLWAPVAVLAAALAFLAIHRDRPPSVDPTQMAGTATAPAASIVKPAEPNTSARPRRPAAPGSPKHAMLRGPSLSAIDRIALQEMRAPSHPAPEQPLTQQEKLLLRVAHSGSPQVMAMLNAEVRERQEAQSEAEFHQFVEQSIKGESEF